MCMCVHKHDKSIIHRLVSFAGLHSALTGVCCANPCKTDQTRELTLCRTVAASNLRPLLLHTWKMSCPVQVGISSNAVLHEVLHLSRPVKERGDEADQ